MSYEENERQEKEELDLCICVVVHLYACGRVYASSINIENKNFIPSYVGLTHACQL
jgi:hypothetical protein